MPFMANTITILGCKTESSTPIASTKIQQAYNHHFIENDKPFACEDCGEFIKFE